MSLSAPDPTIPKFHPGGGTGLQPVGGDNGVVSAKKLKKTYSNPGG